MAENKTPEMLGERLQYFVDEQNKIESEAKAVDTAIELYEMRYLLDPMRQMSKAYR